jgi:hypothetical protein
MSQATHYNTTDHDDTPKLLAYEQQDGFHIMQADTVYTIRPQGNWQGMQTSGMQLCNAWRYGGEQDNEPVEKLLVSAADATDAPVHFEGYQVERFQAMDDNERYTRTAEHYTAADDLVERLASYGFSVESADSPEQLLETA